MTTTVKTYEFPVDVRWVSGRRTIVSVPGKHDLEVSPPPEFQGGVEGMWSPEDLLVGSIASCYAVTFLRLAHLREVPVRSLDVRGSGTLGRREDGHFGFTGAVVHATLETEHGSEQDAIAAAEDAERSCLIAVSMDFPLQFEIDLHVAPQLAAAL